MHLEHEGKPLRLLLDLVEVAQVRTSEHGTMTRSLTGLPQSHTGVNLATVFAEVLEEFGIEDKVSTRSESEMRVSGMSDVLGLQILSITCDNASNNDTMTAELANLLKKFGGSFARTRCFLHITNLTARSLLNEFDVKGTDDLTAVVDEDERELMTLAKEFEEEERDAQHEAGEEVVDESGEEFEDDDDESWVDEVASLSDEERDAFMDEVQPVKKVLLRVS